MRLTPFQAPPAGDTWRDWLKFLVPSGLLGTFGLIIGWRGMIRPALTRLVFYLMKPEDGRVAFREYFGETMSGVTHDLSQNTSAVKTLQRIVENFETQQKQRDELERIERERRDERMDEIANSVTYAVTRFDNALDRLTTAVARLDGATEERRYNDSGHTHRRRDDGA
jgi:hypothetical protein